MFQPARNFVKTFKLCVQNKKKFGLFFTKLNKIAMITTRLKGNMVSYSAFIYLQSLKFSSFIIEYFLNINIKKTLSKNIKCIAQMSTRTHIFKEKVEICTQKYKNTIR